MNKFIIVFILALNFSFAQDSNHLEINQEFNIDQIVYLFGDNVKLRHSPSVDSDVVKLLTIGEPLRIIEKSSESFVYNGINSPWYKVEHNNQHGYVVGGLISIVEKKADNVRFLFATEMVEEKLYIITRALITSKTEYFENKSEFLGSNYGFKINLYNNRGVNSIDNILFINYLPESCGANSGGYYLFLDSNNLYKAIDVFSSADIGFWESENLIFPNDPKGEKDKIIYFQEHGQYSEMDNLENEPTWEKSSITEVNLKWVNNTLQPNPKTITENLNKE
ncbi:SH3 domain-containing protein [Winogradskyella costae]|uniref:SH3 domain-containing protein n=1 Tax=Winogradskyella costae TaxID=2697008 RepID=UPI0015CC083F|nr:SH3 domain-containing protein [Winogradskyella costae]